MKKGPVILFISIFLLASAPARSEEDASRALNKEELFRQIQILADSITLITADYVEPVKEKDLIYGAVQGMMNTLDGYSQFLDPESFKEITEETKGEFGGVGISVGIRDGILTVISPMEDTPASAAGILAGDKIVKISDKITQDMQLDEAVRLLRGEPGTDVMLTILREDAQDLIEIKITRAIIKIDSVKDAAILDDGIAYIKIVEFQERTGRDLEKQVKDLIKKGASYLILDLRNNPGGLLEAAVEVADQFLDKGSLIVYTEGRYPDKRFDFIAKKDPEFGDIGLVALVNGGSASAAEILAGAIKDNKRGLVVGVTTFGKGSVQTVIPMQDDSALRLTTAEYFTPSGTGLMDKGMEPDIYVEAIKPADMDKSVPTDDDADIFRKIDEVKKPVKDEKEEKDEALRERLVKDNQLATAVNIVKGSRVISLSSAEKIRQK
ncbi:MAG: S41 family peptidase [Candidatus Omnitrophica bacterium]|nr:S41 family peptidase [Candidatus Omnitrophota bacterium]